jgi:hypothetical protein
MYECNLCRKKGIERVGSRKEIREHIRIVHGIRSEKRLTKPGHSSKKSYKSPITEAMRKVE